MTGPMSDDRRPSDWTLMMGDERRPSDWTDG